MKRKIIKQAGQAYTITLPIDWVRKHGLDKNNEIDLDVMEKSIVLSTSSALKGETVTLNFTEEKISGRVIRNFILSLYAKGVDEIIINSTIDLNTPISRTLGSALGFALVSQEKNKYVIKDISSGQQHLDEIFKRVFQMVLLFYENAINDIFGEENEQAHTLEARDTEVNKFCLYLQRAISKSSYPDIVKGRALFTCSFELEKIADEIQRFWRTNIKYNPKKTKQLKEIAEITKQGLEKSFDLFYSFSPKLIEEIYALREKAREKSLQTKFKDPTAMRMVRHAVKIVEDAADLNHLAIMMKY